MIKTQRYLALTIGPILPTMELAKSTRAMWTASYLFSYIMRQILWQFREHQFLVPNVDEDGSEFTAGNHAGLFPDRFICLHNGSDDDFKNLNDTINTTVNQVADLIGEDLGNEDLREYFQNYLRCYSMEIELDSNINPITEIYQYLDTLELQPLFNNSEPKSYVSKFLEEPFKNGQRNFLVTQAYEDFIKRDGNVQKVRFNSIPEISTAELSKLVFESDVTPDKKLYWKIFRNEKNDDALMFQELVKHKVNDNKIELMRYHKYIAVIHADGDYMGKIISELFLDNNKEINDRFKQFSKALFAFAKASVKVIEDFGAVPVYVGGDDIMCFSPVVNSGKTVFDLCNEIDKTFYTYILQNEQLKPVLSQVDKAPSLSFGISISYYKHPLGEALAESYRQMRYVAKEKRNSIAFRLQKHSRSYYEASFLKPGFDTSGNIKREGLFGKYFLDLLRSSISDDSFLSSLQYRLNDNQVLLAAIIDDETAIREFFNHNFNERVHENSLFVQNVCEGLIEAQKEYGDPGKSIAAMHAILRFIQFTHQKATDE